MIYCDTSVLVAALAREADTPRAQTWLDARNDGELCISGWVVTEFSGATGMKVRTGELTVAKRAEIQTSWRELVETSVTVVDVPPEAFDLAARFCDRHETGLRSGDALHLAVASLGAHTIATLDRAMAKAAIAVGVMVCEV
jgi:predicted nucleic acid-binding protein